MPPDPFGISLHVARATPTIRPLMGLNKEGIVGLLLLADVNSTAENAIKHAAVSVDYWSLLFVFAMASLLGFGVIVRVSRLLHTPLMSLTNAISGIAVVGSIIVTGDEKYPLYIRILGAIALFASMTNVVSGFLITDRMLKMFKQPGGSGEPKR